MRRVLVPLDGSQLAEAILPDAWRLAGPDGELLLARDAEWLSSGAHSGKYTEWQAVEDVERYLEGVAERLSTAGVRVSAYRLAAPDIAVAIDDTVASLKADVIAFATHGRGPFGRFLLGSVAWKALTNSHVPVLLRHPEQAWNVEPVSEAGQREVGAVLGSMLAVQCMIRASEAAQRRVLVPLDGSPFAEAAIPIARELATEWKAPIYLARVIPNSSISGSLFRHSDTLQHSLLEELAEAEAYLHRVSEQLPGEVHVHAFIGSPASSLVDEVADWAITDVVMTSHGRTALKRAIFGSVADELVQLLHCPIVVIPPQAVEVMKRVEEPAMRHEPVLQSG